MRDHAPDAMTAFMPPHFFVVVTEFKELGFGHGGDIDPTFSAAYGQFVQMVEAGQPVAVYRVDTDDMTVTDVTDDMEAELRRIEALRCLKRADVKRFRQCGKIAAEW